MDFVNSYYLIQTQTNQQRHAQTIHSVKMALDVYGPKRWATILAAHVLPASMENYAKMVVLQNLL